MDLSVSSDAAFGVCWDDYSSTGNMFLIGRSNAPFKMSAKAQHFVATCPMTAVYHAASNTYDCCVSRSSFSVLSIVTIVGLS